MTPEIIPLAVSVRQNAVRLVTERRFGHGSQPACVEIETETENAIHDADDPGGIRDGGAGNHAAGRRGRRDDEIQRGAKGRRRADHARWAASTVDGRAGFIRRRQARGDRRALHRGQGGDRRLLDDRGEVARGGDRLGQALPGLQQRDHRDPPGPGNGGLSGRRSGSGGWVCGTAGPQELIRTAIQGRDTMSDTYLAVFVGSKTRAKIAAWNALSETERKTREKAGMAAWKAWVEKHQ